MSIQKIMLGVKLGAKHAVNFCKRHAPQIMVIAGVAGFGATAVATGNAAIKAKDILEEKNDKLAEIENGKFNPEKAETYYADKKQLRKETAVKLIKTFAPPVTLGAASAALVLGGHHILGRRTAAALASAYEAQKKLYAYDSTVVRELGEETAKKLRNGLSLDKDKVAKDIQEMAKEDEKKPKEEKENKGPIRHAEFFFGKSTCGFGGGWHDDAFKVWSKIRNAYAFSKDRLAISGHLSVNEILWSEFAYPSIVGGFGGWINDPNGYGKDDRMEWRIHTNGNTWNIEDFITDEGFKQFRFDPFNEVWIDFIPAHSADQMDSMCSAINTRKSKLA